MTIRGRGLEVSEVRKHFGGVRALKGISLAFRPGRVHAVLGANGAGKSTMIAVASGAVLPDAGEVTWDGLALTLRSPADGRAAGIAVVHQEPALMPSLTVAQNLMIAEISSGNPLRPIRRQDLRQHSQHKLGRLGVHVHVDQPVGSLPVSARQLVEIARALAEEPRILFLDEPNSSLSHLETDRLMRVVRRLAEEGTAVVLVSHKLREVFAIADDITIMRDGSVVWSGEVGGLDIPHAVDLMAGRAVERLHEVGHRRTPVRCDPVLSVTGLSRRHQFNNISLDVHAGEVVGLTGLVGAGRTELVQTIMGVNRRDAGSIIWLGKEVDWRSPTDAWRSGVAIVPEDRQAEALFPSMSVRWNLESTCKALDITPTGTCEEFAERLRIKAPHLDVPVSELSGGNQQKVVIGRALMTGPRLLILDEPTRGVDVAAKADIYVLIRELANDGCAVLMVSSELEEITELSDQIMVMKTGVNVGEYPAGTTEQALVAASFGEAS